jgi:hypothetical protein
MHVHYLKFIAIFDIEVNCEILRPTSTHFPCCDVIPLQNCLTGRIRPIIISIILGKVNMEDQLDATITVLLISKISSTCFGQTFAHLQERKTEIFLQHMV